MDGVGLAGFELLEPVGRGGSGVVWRARHRSGAAAAVKVLQAEHARARSWQEAFHREIRTIAGLLHPHIVQVYDCGIVREPTGDLVAGSPWLAMAWVEHTLPAWLREAQARRTWLEVRRILLSLLDGLAHAHARGVIHLDIKPQNVLVTVDGEVRLADFGIASTGGDGQSSGAGTPLFMAPERFHLGHPPVPATDLYSVGCLTYWLASGGPPFDVGVEALPFAHLHEAPPRLRLPPGWPEGLADWVEILLAKQARARFDRAADAARALESLDGPSGAGSLAPLPASSAGETWWTRPDTDELPRTEAPAAELQPVAEVPRGWPATPVPSDALSGAGLGLFGVRALPLIGREAEREEVWEALVEVHETWRPRLVCLRGPDGAGKSHLVEHLMVAAHASGAAETLESSHGPTGVGGRGLARMVGRWLGVLSLPPSAAARQVRHALPELGADAEAQLLGWLEGAPLPPEDRDRLVLEVLQAATRRRPAIWWLDDADHEPEVASLVTRVMGGELPILVVVTAASDRLSALEAGAHRVVEVASLGEAETRTLLRAMLGLQPGLAERVAARSGGVPLFAVQLVGDWVRRGVLEPRDGGLALAPGASAPIPDDLHRLWLARLADLPEGVADALEVLAVQGGLVARGEWEAACERLGRTTGLGAAVRRGLVRDEGDALRVAHGLLEEALERRCREAGVWVEVHLACAEALDGKAMPDARIRRARHLVEGGEADQGVEVALEASGELRRVGDFHAAARAVELAERGARGRAAILRVLDVRMRLEIELGAFTESLSTAGRARELAGDEVPGAAGTALRLSGSVRQLLGDVQGSIRDLEAALPLVRAAGDVEQEGDCHQGLAVVLSLAGRREEARAHLDAAEAVWRAADAPEAWFAWIDWVRADWLLGSGELEEAIAASHKVEARFRAAEMPWQALLAQGTRAEVAIQRGRYDEARRLLDAQRQEADALGISGTPRLMMDATWAVNEALAGRSAAVEPMLVEMVEQMEAATWSRRVLGLTAVLVLCAVDRGASRVADRREARLDELVRRHPYPDRANLLLLAKVQERLEALDRERAARIGGWRRQLGA